MRHTVIMFLMLSALAFAGEPKQKTYKLGKLASRASSLGYFRAHVYHVVTDDGYDYTLQPGLNDPLAALSVGQPLQFRIDRGGQFWTPDPKKGKPDHEAKYEISLVDQTTAPTPVTTALTNKDVLEMVRLGLSDTIIIQKINASSPGFDVSITDLKTLKDSGVPDDVVAAMIARSSQ